LGNDNATTYSLQRFAARGERCALLRAYPADWQIYAYLDADSRSVGTRNLDADSRSVGGGTFLAQRALHTRLARLQKKTKKKN
jgi:hypothetical protein